MKQGTGNAREEMQAALRHSRAARLRRRIGWCDRELGELRLIGTRLTPEQARRGLEIRAQKSHLQMHLVQLDASTPLGVIA